MASKGKVSAEELRQQLAEAQGFGEMQSLFAQAWQMFNFKTTDSNDKRLKRGSAATAELAKAMEGGKVMSSDILPLVAILANQLSAPSIGAAGKTSTAERNRFENSRTNYVRQFSLGGGDEGMANIWITLAEMTSRAAENAERLGLYFQLATAESGLMMLNVYEFIELITGNVSQENIFTKMFGDGIAEQVTGIKNDVLSIFETVNKLMPWNVIKELSGGVFSAAETFRDILMLVRAVTATLMSGVSVLKGDVKGAMAYGAVALENGVGAFAGQKGVDFLRNNGVSNLTGGIGGIPSSTPNQMAPNTPAAVNTSNTSNSNIQVTNNVTVASVNDVANATQQATQGVLRSVDNPFLYSVNKGAFPNSGQ